MITNTQTTPVLEHRLTPEKKKRSAQKPSSYFNRWNAKKPKNKDVACKLGKNNDANTTDDACANQCSVIKVNPNAKLDNKKEDLVAACTKNESLYVNNSATTLTKNTYKTVKNRRVYLSLTEKSEVQRLFQQNRNFNNDIELNAFAMRTGIGLKKVRKALVNKRYCCKKALVANLNKQAPKRLGTSEAVSDAACAAQINKSADFAASKNLTPQLSGVTDRASIAGNLSPMFCDTTGSVNHRCIHRVSSQSSVANSMIANAKPYLYSYLTADRTAFPAVGLPGTTVCPASLPCETFFPHNVPLVGAIKKETQKTEKVMVDNVTKPTEMELPERHMDAKLDKEKEDKVAACTKNESLDVNDSAATKNMDKATRTCSIKFSRHRRSMLQSLFQQNDRPEKKYLKKIAKHMAIELGSVQKWFRIERHRCKKAFLADLNKPASKRLKTSETISDAARKNVTTQLFGVTDEKSIFGYPSPMFSGITSTANYRYMPRVGSPVPTENLMIANAKSYHYSDLAAGQTVPSAGGLPYATSFSHNVPLAGAIKKETQKTEKVMVDNVTKPTEMEFSESLKYIDVKLDEEKEDRVAARAKNESLDVNDSAVTATNNTSEAEASEKDYVSFSIPQKKKLWSFFQKSDCHTKEEISNFAKRTNMKFEKVQKWLKIERQRCFLADLNEPAPKRLETFKAPSDAACAVTQINKSEDFATSKNITPQSPDVTDRASIAGNLSPMFYDTTGSVNHRYMHSTGNPLSVADSMMAYANPYLYSVLAAGQTVPSVVGLPYATSFSHSVPLAGTIKKETQKTEKVMVDNVTKSTEMELPERYMDAKLDKEKEDRVAARAKNESLDVNDSAVTATNNTSEAEASEKDYVSFSIPQKKKLWSFFQKSDCHTKEEISNFAKRTNMKFEKVQKWLKIERQRCFLADLNEPAPKRLETFKAPSDAACAVTQINKSEDFATSKNITPQSPDVTDRASIAGNLSPMFYDTTGSVNHRYMHSTGNPLSVADSMMAYANPYLYSVLAAGQTVPSVVGLPYATSFSHSVPLAGTIKKETQKTEKVMVDNVTKSTEMELPERYMDAKLDKEKEDKVAAHAKNESLDVNDSAATKNMDKATKTYRTYSINFSKYQKSVLQSLFQQENYPSREKLIEIAKHTAIELGSVQRWFNVKRYRCNRAFFADLNKPASKRLKTSETISDAARKNVTTQLFGVTDKKSIFGYPSPMFSGITSTANYRYMPRVGSPIPTENLMIANAKSYHYSDLAAGQTVPSAGGLPYATSFSHNVPLAGAIKKETQKTEKVEIDDVDEQIKMEVLDNIKYQVASMSVFPQ